jgi:VWFA-related protein
MRFLPIGVLAVALAAQTPAPTPAPAATPTAVADNAPEVTTREEAPTFQSKVSLVRVPVVVRDHAGQAVGGLTKDDFQIYDKGKLQHLSLFSAEGSAVPKPKPAASEAPAEPAIPGEPAKPATVLPTRFTAYVFDDLNLDVGDLMQARLAATKHMQQALRPTDRAAIYTLSGHVSIEFTDDRALLEAALLKIMPTPHPHDMPPISYFLAEQVERGDDRNSSNPAFALAVSETILCLHLDGPAAVQAPDIARSTARQVQLDGQRQLRNTLLMLKTLAGRLAAMPGDRNIILVSSGFYLADDVRSDMAQLIDRAASMWAM